MFRLGHSAYYVPGVPVQKMIEYFAETVLEAEFSDEETVKTVHKWIKPIRYYYDRTVDFRTANRIDTVFEQIAARVNIPGVTRVTDSLKANVRIYFVTKPDMTSKIGSKIGYEDADGTALFNYSKRTGEIVSGKIYFNSEMPLSMRKSVIPEEIVNLLGLSNDTVMRPDSIIYQYSSKNTKLTKTDWAVLGLLYDSKMKCGMNYSQCRKVIRELYY